MASKTHHTKWKYFCLWRLVAYHEASSNGTSFWQGSYSFLHCSNSDDYPNFAENNFLARAIWSKIYIYLILVIYFELSLFFAYILYLFGLTRNLRKMNGVLAWRPWRPPWLWRRLWMKHYTSCMKLLSPTRMMRLVIEAINRLYCRF